MAGWAYSDFDEYVGARLGTLAGLGFALTGDLRRGDALAQRALMRLWLSGRHAAPDDPEQYVNHAMVSATLARRRPRGAPGALLSSDPQPGQVAAEWIAAEPVRHRFAALPAPERTALALRHTVGLDDAGIALAMGTTAGSAAAAAAAGRARLRAAAGMPDWPDEAVDRAVRVALTPPSARWPPPDAGVRLRARAELHGIRRAEATVAGLAAGLVLVLLAGWLAGVGKPRRTDPSAGPVATAGSAYGPGALVRPLRVVAVGSMYAAPCSTGSPGRSSRDNVTLDGVCLELDRAAIVTVTQVVDLRLIATAPKPGVWVLLTDSDGAAYRAFAAAHRGATVAFVADGRVWATAPAGDPPPHGTPMTVPLPDLDHAEQFIHALRPPGHR